MIICSLGPTSDGWRHIAVKGNVEGQSVYLDGELAGTGGSPVPLPTSGFNFNIGGQRSREQIATLTPSFASISATERPIPLTPQNPKPRESIETRAFIFFVTSTTT